MRKNMAGNERLHEDGIPTAVGGDSKLSVKYIMQSFFGLSRGFIVCTLDTCCGRRCVDGVSKCLH